MSSFLAVIRICLGPCNDSTDALYQDPIPIHNSLQGFPYRKYWAPGAYIIGSLEYNDKKKLVLRDWIDTPRASVLKIEDSHLNPRKLTNLCPTRTRGPVPKWVCFDHVPSEWG